MPMRSRRRPRSRTAFVLLALTSLVTACGTMPSAGPGTDCRALGPAPVTEADAAAVSDELAIWLATAVEYCGW
jgi:predicted small secreted protein